MRDVIARGHLDAGDMVFVDKISFNFRKPHRDEVFVFNTQGIPTNENVNQSMVGPSQYYIKRLAGTPGDKLQIRPPELFLNDQRCCAGPGSQVSERVMSGTLDTRTTATKATRTNAPDEGFPLRVSDGLL